MGKPRSSHLRPALVAAASPASSLDVTSVASAEATTPVAALDAAEAFEPSAGERLLPRRSFIATTVKTAAFLAAFQVLGGRQEAKAAGLGFDPFVYGVASGDPLPDRIIIWTRVTPAINSLPGSGLGIATRGVWEVSLNAAFTQKVRTGRFLTAVASDHTVKIDVAGLQPATAYFYRFYALGVYSPVGRMLTAPAAGTAPASVRFGMVSCSNYEAGYFTAYRNLATRDDLDFIVHLGDYIYEYATGVYGPPGFAAAAGRTHQPTNEILSLADYRQRHAQHKADPDLRALHQRHPFITTWDDHETANNSWRDGAENHTPGTEGSWADRKAAGIQAYFEWMPLRIQTPTGESGEVRRIYRSFRFGRLMELNMLDLRSYRTAQPVGSLDSIAINSSTATLLGSAQTTWTVGQLVASLSVPTTWRFFGNSVQIAPVQVNNFLVAQQDANAAGLIQGLYGIPADDNNYRPLNIDSWDGYNIPRNTILGVIAGAQGAPNAGNPIPNCVFLTGDIHSTFASEIPASPTAYAAAPTSPSRVSLGVEFVCTSVTSDNVNELIPGSAVGAPSLPYVPERIPNGSGGYMRNTATPSFEGLITAFNPWIKDVNLDFHGFSVVDVTSARTQVDHWILRSDANDTFAADPRIDPNAQVIFRNAVQTAVNTQQISLAAAQLGPR
jgi:alkaline phosphatase D